MQTPLDTKKNKKNFLKQETKDKILELYSQGIQPRQIAQRLVLRTRQVRDFIDNHTNHKVNIFTTEEDKTLIYLYMCGITKEWTLVSYFPNKKPWMIRNRIQYLKKHKIMFQIPTGFHIVTSEPPVKVQENTDADTSFETFDDNSYEKDEDNDFDNFEF